MRILLPAGPLHRKLHKATMWLAFAIAAIGGGVAVWTLFGPILLSDGGEDFTPFALYGMRRGAQLRLAAGAAALAIFVAVSLALRANDESGIAGGVKRVVHALVDGAARTESLLNRKPYVYWGAVVALVAAVNYVALLDVAWLPCLNPDSSGYFVVNPNRTIGYVLAVTGTIALFGDVSPLVPIQLNAMLIGFVVLGDAFARTSGSRLAGMLFCIVTIPASSLLMLRDVILTEALFVAFLCLHLAAAIRLIGTRRIVWAVAAGLTMGLTILVRPAGYALIACVPIIWLLVGWRKSTSLFCVGASVAAILFGAALYNQTRFGTFATQSYGGISLVVHVAHLIRADMPTREPALAARIDHATADLRAGISDMAFPYEYWYGTMNLYNTLLWQRVFPEIVAAANARLPGASGEKIQAEVSRLSMALALEAIAASPGAYLKHVAGHYCGLWAVTLVPYGTLSAHALECYVGTRGILAAAPQAFASGMPSAIYESPEPQARFASEAGKIRALDLFWFAVTSFQIPIIAAVLAISAIGFLALIGGRRLDATEQAVIYAAACVQAYIGLVVGVQAAISRYAVVIEPYVLLAVIGGALVFARRMPPIAAPRTARSTPAGAA
ncbi:MAG: hypothetical protein IBJ15_03580 [Alphaproteobacteria bacterium]|nr:hypothetical protein [Alphaproteobacteria bacterium]